MFQLVPKAAVYQCVSVCKAWETAALQGYYQELSLSAEVVKILKPILRPTDNTPPEVSPSCTMFEGMPVVWSHSYFA